MMHCAAAAGVCNPSALSELHGLLQVAERWKDACPRWFDAALARLGAELAPVYEDSTDLLPIQAREAPPLVYPHCIGRMHTPRRSLLLDAELARGGRVGGRVLHARRDCSMPASWHPCQDVLEWHGHLAASTKSALPIPFQATRPCQACLLTPAHCPTHCLRAAHIVALQQLMVCPEATQLRPETLLQLWGCTAASQRQGLVPVRRLLDIDGFKPSFDFIDELHFEHTFQVRGSAPHLAPDRPSQAAFSGQPSPTLLN